MTRNVVQLRVSDEEKRSWVMAAGDGGLSEWLRFLANREVGNISVVHVEEKKVETVAVKSLCIRCARAQRVGQPLPKNCEECGR